MGNDLPQPLRRHLAEDRAALDQALVHLADVPRLLVVSDYDGVLAPIVADPAQAFPLPAAITAVRELVALPATAVAVVSGRGRADLAGLAGLPAEVTLVGSHGAELAGSVALDPAQRARHRRLVAAGQEIVQGRLGVRLETKPASVVVHTRTATREVAAAAAAAVRDGPATWPGVHLTTGKEVLELAVLAADKGTAVTALRARSRADAVLFLGDDATDEDAFAVLAGDDVGVKVGPGDTRAGFRVPDPAAAVHVLELVGHHRSALP